MSTKKTSGKKKAPAKLVQAHKAMADKSKKERASAPTKKATPKDRSSSKRKEPGDTKFVLGDVVQRDCEVAWRIIDGEAVVITPVDSTMHSLNDTGTRIWEAIDGHRSLKDVAEAVAVDFEVDRVKAEKDTVWFVECLAKKGLIEKL